MKNDPTKWIISIGFSAILALMFIVTYLSLKQMDENIDQMSHLIEETYAKYASVHKMRNVIQGRGETLDSMYLTDDFFERDLALLHLSDTALEYKVERDIFKSHTLRPAELRIIKKLNPLINKAKISTDISADILLSLASDEDIRKALIVSQNDRKDVLSTLSELTEAQDKLAINTLNDSMKYHENSKQIIIYLTLSTFFLGVFISLLVIRQSSTRSIEIHHQARHDNLTGLPNRKEFEHRLQLAFWKAKENNTNHALCCMDLDHFKIINDTCGHDAGDKLLIDITRIIKEKIRSHDVLGRLGGDEFGLILKNCSLEKALEITQGLVTVVKKYEFHSGDRVFQVGVSIGVVAINNQTGSYASAMSNADIACYAAKDMGRNRVHIHELNDNQISTMQKELYWVADIQSSIRDNRFKLFIQSISSLKPNTSTTMYEVLLRLKDDDGNMVSPGEYIPAAERFGLMKDVDLWVIETALQYSKQLNSDPSRPQIKLFINLSANSLGDSKVCDFILNKMDELNIPKGSLCFEITETAAIKNIEQANKMINKLKAKHAEFALDDFGSGMSSFGYLKNLDVDYLKIDGSFILNMADNTIDYAMVAAMNEIGNIMGIETIAEHVENSKTLQKIQELGIQYAQGFHLEKPRPIEELIDSIITK